jgi:peptidoglycan/xylan/chitin deacetylase (PgdA/CDA1 family)
MKSAAVRVGASVLFHSGVLNFLQTRERMRIAEKSFETQRRLPFAVLLYHRVNANRDPYFPSVSTNVFEGQMSYLARNYRVLSLAEILNRIQQGLEIEPYTIAITFDDGYRDNFTHAHAVLRKYRLPATLFVATGYIGADRMMWNDQLSWAFKQTDRSHCKLELGNRHLEFSLHSPADKISSLNLMLETLKSIPEDEKSRIVDSIVTDLTRERTSLDGVMLTWRELRKMVEEGWDVGSHTVNHVVLTRVTAAVVKDELGQSKQILEKELQRPISLFAYPNGKEPDFNLSTKELVRQIGYKAAATTVEGLNDRNSDPWKIRRRSPWECPLPYFAAELFYSYWRNSSQFFNSGVFHEAQI